MTTSTVANLVIAAHPDDEVLGCGGLISRRSAEEEFYVLFLTGGANTRYDISMEKVLRDQAKQAGALLGVRDYFFETLPNQGLDSIPILEVTQVIERILEQV